MGTSLRERLKERTNIVRFVLAHPMNRDHRLMALGRMAGWQVRRRLIRRPEQVRFWNGLKVHVYPDWPYSWTAILFRLPEYDGMMFTLRYLRRDDWFIDVGANIGFYSLIAASVAGDRSVLAVEPHPTAAARLRENAALNSFHDLHVVEAAAGEAPGTAQLTSNLFDQNRIVPGATGATIKVRVVTLDSALAEVGVDPDGVALVKVDTEGFDARVVAGASSLLDARPGPVWMVEDDESVAETFHAHGYEALRYLAEENRLVARDDPAAAYTVQHLSRETLYARRPDDVARRLGATPALIRPPAL